MWQSDGMPQKNIRWSSRATLVEEACLVSNGACVSTFMHVCVYYIWMCTVFQGSMYKVAEYIYDRLLG